MKKWMLSGAAVALIGAACGGSGTSDGAAAVDAGADHASAPDGGREGGADAATDVGAKDTGAPLEAAPDAPAEVGPVDAQADAAACPSPQTKQGAACDTCIADNCESTWCACRGDTDNVNDAGVSGCLLYVACVEQCVATDAGTPTDCLGTVCATAPYTLAEQHEGHAFIDCRVQYCSTECGQ